MNFFVVGGGGGGIEGENIKKVVFFFFFFFFFYLVRMDVRSAAHIGPLPRQAVLESETVSLLLILSYTIVGTLIFKRNINT